MQFFWFVNLSLENNLFTCKNAWNISEIHLRVNCDHLYEELAYGVFNVMSKTQGTPAVILIEVGADFS